MVTEQGVLQVIADSNQEGRSRTLAEFVAAVFTGKFIEIYLSDSYEEVSTEQISTAYPAVFCGRVVGAYRECLIINSVFAGTNGKLQLGNLMFINERAVKALNEIDGNSIMEDMFLRSKESLVIKKHFVDGE